METSWRDLLRLSNLFCQKLCRDVAECLLLQFIEFNRFERNVAGMLPHHTNSTKISQDISQNRGFRKYSKSWGLPWPFGTGSTSAIWTRLGCPFFSARNCAQPFTQPFSMRDVAVVSRDHVRVDRGARCRGVRCERLDCLLIYGRQRSFRDAYDDLVSKKKFRRI